MIRAPTHQNSPSSSTVMPRFPLSVSPTLDHSSELMVNREKVLFSYIKCTYPFQTRFYVESHLCFNLFFLFLHSMHTSMCMQHKVVKLRREADDPAGLSSKFHMPFCILQLLWPHFHAADELKEQLYAFYSQSKAVAPPPDDLTLPPVPHLSLQAPFHSVLPHGFLMRISGIVSFRK